MTKTDKL